MKRDVDSFITPPPAAPPLSALSRGRGGQIPLKICWPFFLPLAYTHIKQKRIRAQKASERASYLRRESNSDQKFRKLLFYPLNYRGICLQARLLRLQRRCKDNACRGKRKRMRPSFFRFHQKCIWKNRNLSRKFAKTTSSEHERRDNTAIGNTPSRSMGISRTDSSRLHKICST